jgi:Fic family protein
MSAEDQQEVRRHSIAAEASLIAGPQARAEAEARNGLKQFDVGRNYIEEGIGRDTQFKLRPSMLLTLHREALDGLSAYAGNWRPASVAIEGSAHAPVGAHLVAGLIEELCDYVNDNWEGRTAIHLAAYVMWRLNWIHPFSDGNGRTSRIASYIVLSVKMGCLLPGIHTIPDQIVENRDPYFQALESADQAWADGNIDLSRMEELLERMLAAQLLKAVEAASGKQTNEL